jgi:CRISPR-associated endoribonuclease Cas6
MRVKITFLRAKDSNASVPLHHQKLVSSFVEFLITEIGQRPAFYNFSSLKGTSKVQNGFVRFMSSKVSLVFSSNDDAFVKAFMEKLMDKKMVHIGKLMLTPKAYQVVDAPVFATQMKYVCISPVVLVDPQLDSQGAMEIADPTSHDFSDLLYNAVADHMEKSGYTDEQLNAYAEFGAVPDAHYMHKVNTGLYSAPRTRRKVIIP